MFSGDFGGETMMSNPCDANQLRLLHLRPGVPKIPYGTSLSIEFAIS